MSAALGTSAVAAGQGAWRRTWAPAAGVLALAVLPLLSDGAAYRDVLIRIFLWAAIAGAWNIVGGFASQFSLGHAAFFGLGAYTSTLLFQQVGISPWFGMLAGVALAAVLALALGAVTLRLRGHYFALATLAAGVVAEIVAVNWRTVTQGSVGLSVPLAIGFENMLFEGKLPYAYLTLTLALGVCAVAWGIRNSRLGYALLAYRDDPDAALALGIPTTRVKVIALVISAALTAVAGTLYAQYVLFIDPPSVVGVDLSVQAALIAIVGGLGTVSGPVLGALLVIPLAQVLRASLGTVFSGAHLIVYGGLLIAILLLMPQGIRGALAAAAAWAGRVRGTA